MTISLHAFENSPVGASEIDTPIEHQKWSGRFVERIRGSDRISSIGVVEITIPEEGASLRIHGFLKKSSDFTWYIRQILQKVTISLHTFENSAFGGLEFDTPIEDEKWSGRFVERIWGSDRRSSIGVVEIMIPEEGASLRIHRFLKKSNDFA